VLHLISGATVPAFVNYRDLADALEARAVGMRPDEKFVSAASQKQAISSLFT
jgi:hypothetical protein